MNEKKNIVGLRSGQLTVVEFSHIQKNHYYWKCSCECGGSKTVQYSYLVNSLTKSCGCIVSPPTKQYHERKKQEVIANHAVNGDCWDWAGSIAPDGYGRCCYRKNRHFKAYRLSYIVFNGDIPDGMWVLHQCDNRKCVNPDHLYLGDRERNTNDMMDRNRSNKGVDRPLAKLNNEKVLQSRKLHNQGNSIQSIADRFGVSHGTIYNAVKGKTWKHV